MTITDVVTEIEAAGAALRLDGDRVLVSYPNAEVRKKLAGRVALLRERRGEVAALVKARDIGGPTDPQPRPDEDHRADAYAEQFELALRQICRPDYPQGMIPWLGQRYPSLYEQLTARIPDELNRLWSDHAPLEEFDRVVTVWLEAHRTACELYRAAKLGNGVQTSLPPREH